MTHFLSISRQRKIWVRQEVDVYHAALSFYSHNHVRQFPEKIELTLAKKIQRFSHPAVNEIRIMLEDSGRWSPETEKEYISFVARCQARGASARRNDRTNISLFHVNDAFKNEVQADFIVVNIRDVNHYVNIIMKRFLQLHGNRLCQIPASSWNKKGRVEGKKEYLKL